MARTFVFRTMELAEGVTEEEFEKFMQEEWPAYSHIPGATGGWFKCIKGEREGKYLSYMEYEDIDAFNERYYTSEGERTEEIQLHLEANPQNSELFAKFMKLSEDYGKSTSEYVEIEIEYLS